MGGRILKRVTAAACFVGSLALASPARAAPPDDAARPTVAVEGAGDLEGALGEVWFELDQAGFGSATTDAADFHVGVERPDEGWRVRIVGGAADVTETLPPEATPQTVALAVVELLRAAQLVPGLGPGPGPAPAVPDPPDPAPPVETAAPEAAVASGPEVRDVVRAPSGPRRSGWAFDVGLSPSNYGVYAASLGVRHRWRRPEVALELGGGALGQSEEVSGTDGSSSELTGATLRVRLSGAWAFRPGRTWRPTLGLGSTFLVPFIRSSYEGPDTSVPQSDAIISSDGTATGLVWVPTPELGLRVSLRGRSALWFALRGGRAVTLRHARLATGEPLETSDWYFGGSMAWAFGPA